MPLCLNAQTLKGKYQSPHDLWEWGGFEEIHFEGEKFSWATGGCIRRSYNIGAYKYYPRNKLLVLFYLPNPSKRDAEKQRYNEFREDGVDSLHNVHISKRKLRYTSPLNSNKEVLIGKPYNR